MPEPRTRESIHETSHSRPSHLIRLVVATVGVLGLSAFMVAPIAAEDWTQWRGDDRLGVSLGDIAGKGLPAALFMAKLQATIRAVAPEIESLSDLAREINRIFWYVVLNVL